MSFETRIPGHGIDLAQHNLSSFKFHTNFLPHPGKTLMNQVAHATPLRDLAYISQVDGHRWIVVKNELGMSLPAVDMLIFRAGSNVCVDPP